MNEPLIIRNPSEFVRSSLGPERYGWLANPDDWKRFPVEPLGLPQGAILLIKEISERDVLVFARWNEGATQERFYIEWAHPPTIAGAMRAITFSQRNLKGDATLAMLFNQALASCQNAEQMKGLLGVPLPSSEERIIKFCQVILARCTQISEGQWGQLRYDASRMSNLDGESADALESLLETIPSEWDSPLPEPQIGQVINCIKVLGVSIELWKNLAEQDDATAIGIAIEEKLAAIKSLPVVRGQRPLRDEIQMLENTLSQHGIETGLIDDNQ